MWRTLMRWQHLLSKRGTTVVCFSLWGKLGRGYLIPADETYLRLQRGVKAYHGISLSIVIICVAVWGAVAALLVMPFLIVGYWI